MTILLLTPRCRRPPDSVVTLCQFWLHADDAHYCVPTGGIRLVPATTPQVVQAVSSLSTRLPRQLHLTLPSLPRELHTTTVWQATFAHCAPVMVTHVVRWLLPSDPAPVLSDDTWQWHHSPAPPAISPGDWPVMDIVPPRPRRRRRCSLTVIDTRNRRGLIDRRYQTFPLAPLTEETPSTLAPVTPLFPCKENPLCTFIPERVPQSC